MLKNYIKSFFNVNKKCKKKSLLCIGCNHIQEKRILEKNDHCDNNKNIYSVQKLIFCNDLRIKWYWKKNSGMYFIKKIQYF